MLKRIVFIMIIAFISVGLFAYGGRRSGKGDFRGSKLGSQRCEFLELTEEQKKEMDKIRLKYDKKIFKVQDREKRHALREEMHVDMEKILTEEQKENFAPGKGRNHYLGGNRQDRGLRFLNLSSEQKEEIKKIREEERERILNILTEEQKKELLKKSIR